METPEASDKRWARDFWMAIDGYFTKYEMMNVTGTPTMEAHHVKSNARLTDLHVLQSHSIVGPFLL
jgi:hypothetical protein